MSCRNGVLGLSLACSVAFCGADSSHAGLSKPQDLTDQSLEELLQAEVVPLNVLGAHTHLGGQIMLGYRFMYTDYSHNLEGTHQVSEAEVLARYPVVHTHMTMEMHMAEVMYAPLDRLTFEAMIPYTAMTMDHLLRNGTTRTDKSSGLGDVSFMAMINLLGDPRHLGNRLVLDAGFTAPTGSIDEGDGGKRFEYAMQLGSGTWDLRPGLTYLGESEMWAWGAQAIATVRLGENANGYRLGNAYWLGAWGELKLANWFAPSLRMAWHAWSNINGADPELDPARNPAFDAAKQSGERLDLVLGVNFYAPKGLLKGTRLSIEGGVPIYQNLAGPNIAADWFITAGLTYTF